MNFTNLAALSLVALVAGESLLPQDRRPKAHFGWDVLSYLAVAAYCFVLYCATWLIDLKVLAPLGLGVLRSFVYASLLVGALALKKWGLQKWFPKWCPALLPYGPRVAVFCGVLGVGVLMGDVGGSVPALFRQGAATAGIFFATAFVFLCLQQALKRAVPPKALRGLPFYLLLAGLLMLAAVGFL